MRRCVQCGERFHDFTWCCPACGFAPIRLEGTLSFCQPNGVDGFDPEAFNRLVELEHASFWFRARSRLIQWALQRYFPNVRRLLEIGCGTGFVLEGLRDAFPSLSLAGGELHAAGLSHASTRVPTAELLQFDARNIPFADEFDVVGAFDVLEHIETDEQVLREMRTALKPGGGIVVTVPQHAWLWSATDEYAEHKRRYSRSELLSKITVAGFVVLRATSFVSLLLPAMVAMRLRTQLSKRPFDPDQEHAMARRGTTALEQIIDLERSLISRGIDLPLGGSLLVVATRA
jgi:SAM-dependent methyltransferase